MFRCVIRLIAVLAALPASGQDSNTTFASSYVSAPNYTYKLSASSLDQLDFKNFRIFYQPGDPSDRGVTLHKGKYSKRDEGSYEEVALEDVEVLISSTETEHYTFISVYWKDCGGSCTIVGKVQVFTLRDHHPTIVQQIEYDRQAEGTGHSSIH